MQNAGKKTRKSTYDLARPLGLSLKKRHRSLVLPHSEDALKTAFECLEDLLGSIYHQLR
jgi:hypothetical protein